MRLEFLRERRLADESCHLIDELPVLKEDNRRDRSHVTLARRFDDHVHITLPHLPLAPVPGGGPKGGPGLGLQACYFDPWGNGIAQNTFKNNGFFANPTNGALAEISGRHLPGNCWHENVDSGGVTTAPVRLQKTNGICGVAHAGAQIGSALTAQVICASELFGPCPSNPGRVYPRPSHLVLPALPTHPASPTPSPLLTAPPRVTTPPGRRPPPP